MKLIFDYKFRFFRFFISNINQICFHFHCLFFSSIILSFKQCVLDSIIRYNMKITLVLISNAISKTFWPWCAITIEKPFYSFTKQAVCQIIFWIPIIIKVKCVYEWMNEVNCVTISGPSHLHTPFEIFQEFSKINLMSRLKKK
jgi:hypothetical protein